MVYGKNYLLLIMYDINFYSRWLMSRLPQTFEYVSEFSRVVIIKCTMGKAFTFPYISGNIFIPIQKIKLLGFEVIFKWF